MTVTRIAVFADVQNIYYTTRQAFSHQFNYRKRWQKISSEYEIVSAYATAYAIHRGDDSQPKLQNALKHIGFNVKLKPYIQSTDGSAKGDWDVGITINALEAAPGVDTIIPLPGDGDFDLMLEKVKSEYGVSAEVYEVPALTVNSLIDSVTEFYPIGEYLLL